MISNFSTSMICVNLHLGQNGTRRQAIEIYYSFVGKIDLPEA